MRNAEIKGTVHRDTSSSLDFIWPNALEAARENTLTDAAVCVSVNFSVVSVCVHIP